ncbi:MAG TPA: copper homeostasis membrane protein CopD [Micropepsaceae bacterium]|nr:copper homeostasis membrane protein CopD [Micropepsaceae bacterium]
MIAAAGLIASRFLHYAALTILFGVAAFPVYNNHGRTPSLSEAAAFFPWARRVQIGAALVALVSGVFWLDFVAANMSGELSSLIDPKILSLVVTTTEFGQVWGPRLGLIAFIVILLAPKQQPETLRLAVLAAAAIALTSIADTGHAGADSGPRASLHISADAAHLLAAGIWIGALLVLARMTTIALRSGGMEDLRSLDHALSRFSAIGPVVVGVLTLSGILNPGFLASLKTEYGQVLLGKLGLFGAMLLLAAANRFRLGPRLAAAMMTGTATAEPARALWLSIIAESLLALLVLIAVAWLGTLAPPPPA